jgi:hypothetical protein
MDELFKIVAECAFLQRCLDKIQEKRCSNTEEACAVLLQRCLEVEEKLQNDWLNKSAVRHDGKPHPAENNLQCDPNTLPLDVDFEPYEFNSLETAKTYILFWVCSLVARRVLYHTEKLLRRNPDPAHAIFYAQEICRSLAFCMQAKFRVSSAQVVLFGVSQAAKWYIECGERERFIWCQKIYPMIRSSGFTVVNRLSQAECEYWNASQSQPVLCTSFFDCGN